jgi:hypothetical protein
MAAERGAEATPARGVADRARGTEPAPDGRVRRGNAPGALGDPERGLVAGAATVAFGIALAGTFSRLGGGIALLVGWGVLVVSLHRFGRSGRTDHAAPRGDSGTP